MRCVSKILGVVSLAFCAAFTACGGGGSTTQSSTPSTPSSSVALQTITVSPSASSLLVGQSQQFAATALYSDGSSKDVTANVTWSSSNATVLSITGSGVVQANAEGSATITALMSGVKGSASVSAKSSAATMNGLSVAPASAMVGVGATVRFSATASFSDLSVQDVSSSAAWSSSDDTVASIDAGGAMTALKTGVATITAKSGSFTGTAVVTVTSASLQSIYLLPASGSVAAGESQQFSAYGIYSDNSQQDLTNLVSWSSSDTTVATIQNSGLAQSLKTGSTTATASFSGMTASASLQVTSASLSSITISPYLPTVPVGGFQQFTATGTFTDGSSQDLTNGVVWGSDNSSVASITSSGMATGVAAGAANLSACVGSVCDSTSVRIIPATVVSIQVLPGSASIAAGTSQQFTAIATYTDGSTEDITSGATWTSSLPGSAPVNAAGLVTTSAVASSVTITASEAGVSGSATLNVTAATLIAISVTPAVQTVGLNTTVQFTATGIFSDGSSEDLTNTVAWSSSNASVATISNTGLATTLGVGSAQVSATYAGVDGSTTLTVIVADLVSITINHSATSAAAVNSPFMMGRHTREQFYAWGNYSDGSSHRLYGSAWSSSKVSFASVTGDGILRAKQKTGSVTITATFAGVSGTLAVTVTNASLSSLAIAPAAATIAPETQQQYALIGTYSDGTTQDLSLQGYWQTSSYSVATVSKGTVTGAAPGAVEIKAWFQGVTAPSVTLTVSNAAIEALSITPPTPAVQLGLTQQFTATANFSDGTQQDVSSVVQWSSSNPAVAIVNTTGLAVTAGQGTTNIGATFKSASSSTVLTVN